MNIKCAMVLSFPRARKIGEMVILEVLDRSGERCPFLGKIYHTRIEKPYRS
jgi:hypothetical protein